MNSIMLLVGLGIVGMGAAIWRYQWIHLLSNVRPEEVDETKKEALARFAGRYLVLVGAVVVVLAYLTEKPLIENTLLIIVSIAVALMFLLTGLYLRGLRQFMKK